MFATFLKVFYLPVVFNIKGDISFLSTAVQGKSLIHADWWQMFYLNYCFCDATAKRALLLTYKTLELIWQIRKKSQDLDNICYLWVL